MDNKYYILKDKKVIAVNDVIEWAKEFETSTRTIQQDTLDDGTIVSTVFLGLNHRFDFFNEGEKLPPIVFETMIFGGEHDGYQERYSTYEEAEEGHQKAIEIAKNSPK